MNLINDTWYIIVLYSGIKIRLLNNHIRRIHDRVHEHRLIILWSNYNKHKAFIYNGDNIRQIYASKLDQLKYNLITRYTCGINYKLYDYIMSITYIKAGTDYYVTELEMILKSGDINIRHNTDDMNIVSNYFEGEGNDVGFNKRKLKDANINNIEQIIIELLFLHMVMDYYEIRRITSLNSYMWFFILPDELESRGFKIMKFYNQYLVNKYDEDRLVAYEDRYSYTNKN
jgi:hypothetical protein